MKRLIKVVVVLLVLVVGLGLFVRAKFGGGQRLPDLTTAPIFDAAVLETVAELDYPPGNIAVSKTGRVFLTLHPDGRPPTKVHELVDGKLRPYPDEAYQDEAAGIPWFQSILSLRIDRQGRLWVLDFAEFGQGQPRISAFDLATDELVTTHDFPTDVAGLGSMLNDFQVSPDGKKIYIAETSPLIHRPAILVYDVEAGTSRRVLDDDPSVNPEPYIIQAPGRDMIIYGIYTMLIGVDSIALDTRGEWLYYGPVTGDRMYRIKAADLDDESLDAAELADRVQDFAGKTLSDGLTMDVEDNIYLSDMENSAVLTLAPDGKLTTLVKDARLRWPDGFSFGPDGWLYVTCSSLQHVLFVDPSRMRDNAPYHVYRFKPGPMGIPGH